MINKFTTDTKQVENKVFVGLDNGRPVVLLRNVQVSGVDITTTRESNNKGVVEMSVRCDEVARRENSVTSVDDVFLVLNLHLRGGKLSVQNVVEKIIFITRSQLAKANTPSDYR